MNEYQYYPTPKSLAYKAFSKFTDTNIKYLLEPSAGRGNSIELLKDFISEETSEILSSKFYSNGLNIRPTFTTDVLEINQDNIPFLKEKDNVEIVGYDFLQFNGSPIYSHIFMNPPFANGVKHVLHAWDILFSGEMVAIVNAETIRNAFSNERQLLIKIIEDNNGTVEFVTDAFQSDDTEVKAVVEVAIIHLVKKQDIKTSYITGLKKEKEDKYKIENPYENEVAIAGTDNMNKFKNLVIAFECATEAAKESIIASIKFEHYDKQLASSHNQMAKTYNEDVDFQSRYNKIYNSLKRSAWNAVVHSTDILNRQSVQGQKRIKSEMDNITKLEFTMDNIMGFLGGMINSAPQIQIEMCCDVFDRISKYHSDNRTYYMGWKSNDIHRTMAFKIKDSRFILPVKTGFIGNELDYSSSQILADFDKVMCLLDGKNYDANDPELSVNTKLVQGKRVPSRYFDLRFYMGVGTVHFYCKRPDLIQRLNRIVGKYRNWLPMDDSHATKGFNEQYEASDSITANMRKKTEKKHQTWNDPKEHDLGSDYATSRDKAVELYGSKLEEAMIESGIVYDWLLAGSSTVDTNAQDISNTELPLMDNLDGILKIGKD